VHSAAHLRHVHPFLSGVHCLLSVVDCVLWAHLRPVGTQSYTRSKTVGTQPYTRSHGHILLDGDPAPLPSRDTALYTSTSTALEFDICTCPTFSRHVACTGHSFCLPVPSSLPSQSFLYTIGFGAALYSGSRLSSADIFKTAKKSDFTECLTHIAVYSCLSSSPSSTPSPLLPRGVSFSLTA